MPVLIWMSVISLISGKSKQWTDHNLWLHQVASGDRILMALLRSKPGLLPPALGPILPCRRLLGHSQTRILTAVSSGWSHTLTCSQFLWGQLTWRYLVWLCVIWSAPSCDQDSAVLSDPGVPLLCPSLVCNSLTAALWSNSHGVQVAFSASIVLCSTSCVPKQCQVKEGKCLLCPPLFRVLFRAKGSVPHGDLLWVSSPQHGEV